MNDRKRPVVIGPKIDESSDPILRKYKGGVAERAAQRREDRPKIGDLASANESYKPGRDGPMTIDQITRAGAAAAAEPAPGGLSAKSIQGMQAVAAATAAARSGKAPTPSKTPVKETKKMEATETQPEKKDAEAKKPAEMSAEVKTALDNADEFELQRIMRGIQNDVIHNSAEREHVDNPANKRIDDVDFANGISSGEFTQIVDIIPGKLKVHYRTVSAMENQAARLWIFQKAAEDPRLDKLSGEMFGIALLVMSVRQINTVQYPDHLKRTGPTLYGATFDDDAFAAKLDQFMHMPQPLLHSIGVHGEWFDLRIRKMFTTDFAKNG